MTVPGGVEMVPGRGRRRSDVALRQGHVIEWNGFTGENIIEVGGTPIENVPLLNTVEMIGVRPGEIVVLIQMSNTYCVLGRAINPSEVDYTKNVALLRDFYGNAIFMPDLLEPGIAKPYLGIPMHHASISQSSSTTSASFETLFRGHMFKQHPRLRMAFSINTGVGVTAEVRMTSNGIQVGSTQAVPASTFTNYIIGPDEVDGIHEQPLVVELQARRTAGATAVQVWMDGVTAMQS